MNSSLKFEAFQIAACGINCGACLAFLRENNKCPGCRIKSISKPKTRTQCIIKNCSDLAATTSGYCYDCEKFPCKRMNQLDKRYTTKYRTSLIDNLKLIKDQGMKKFLEADSLKRTCPNCGKITSIHRNTCLGCMFELN